jgi:hypothetical protein
MKNDLNKYSKWEKETFNVIDLRLDSENIRQDITDKTQGAIILDLFVNENTMQVLKSISENGFFPDELPIVIHEKNQHIVVEGNRRIAALRAMINPSLAGQYEQRIKVIMREIKAIEKIEVIVAPNRDSVNKLLANKHTRVTRKAWKPLRQAYCYHAQIEGGKSIADLKLGYPSVDIVKFIKMWEIHRIATSIQYDSSAIEGYVHDQRNFPVSTLERLYDDKNFRELASFDFDSNGLVRVASKEQEFRELFKIVISDAVTNVIDTRKLNKEDARKNYLSKFKPLQKTEEHITSKSFTPQKPVALKKVKNKLDVKGVNFQLPYPAVERMFDELSRINIDDNTGFPNATHDLLRSFLECGLKAFFETHSIIIKKTGQYAFLKDALDTFVSDEQIKTIAGNKYLPLKGLVEKVRQQQGAGSMLEYTANFMNQVNHSHYIFSDAQSVRNGWDALKPLFMFILETV